jgi:hypothetical protein
MSWIRFSVGCWQKCPFDVANWLTMSKLSRGRHENIEEGQESGMIIYHGNR